MIVAQVEHLECSERRPPPACLLSVIHSFLDFQLFLSFHCRGIFSFFQLLILRARIGMKRTGKWWRRREWNKRTKKWTETEEKKAAQKEKHGIPLNDCSYLLLTCTFALEEQGTVSRLAASTSAQPRRSTQRSGRNETGEPTALPVKLEASELCNICHCNVSL